MKERNRPDRRKPFKCDICDTRFESETHLKAHIDRVHEGKKPFKCEHCKVGFS